VRVLDAHMPPLRARVGDLPLLVGHFLGRYTPDGERVPGLSPCAWALLREYAFPGNVRELEHAIRHAVVLSRGEDIDVHHLPDELRRHASNWTPESDAQSLADALAACERVVLVQTLESVDWSRTRAAERLRISRKSLWEKLKRHGITRPVRPD
jgi:DNA-binding NtrC family response regulator